MIKSLDTQKIKNTQIIFVNVEKYQFLKQIKNILEIRRIISLWLILEWNIK